MEIYKYFSFKTWIFFYIFMYNSFSQGDLYLLYENTTITLPS